MLLVQELGESTGQLKVLLGKVQTQLLQMKSEGRIVKRVQRAKACGVKAKQTLMICGNAMGILGDFSRIGGKLNLMMRCQGSSPSCDAKQDKSQPVGWDSSCVGLLVNVKDAILHSLWHHHNPVLLSLSLRLSLSFASHESTASEFI